MMLFRCSGVPGFTNSPVFHMPLATNCDHEVHKYVPVPFLRNFHWGGGGGAKQEKKAERKI